MFVCCKCKFRQRFDGRFQCKYLTWKWKKKKRWKTSGSPFIDQKVKYAGLWQRGTKTERSSCSLNLSWTPVITAWPNRNFLLDMTYSEEPAKSGKPFLCNLKVLMTSKLGDGQYSLRSVTFSRIVVDFPLLFFYLPSFLQCASQPLCLENLSVPLFPITSNSVRYKTWTIVNHRYNFISIEY